MTNETGGRKLLFLMTGEQAEAFARLVEAAGRGDGGAACRLGDLYREGLGGLRYSPKETYRWYAKSALAGDPNGQNNLGACYEHGLGCAQSYPKAVKWYRLSVAQGLSTASMNLGYCYLHGHGVTRDQVEALRLFREAVERGEERAQQEVEKLAGERDSQVRELSEAAGDQTAPGGEASADTPAAPTARPRPRVRFVDRTHSGRHVGVVGAGGVSPPESGDDAREESTAGWTDEDFERVSLGAWEKDDCFDLPEPGSEYARVLMAGSDELLERLGVPLTADAEAESRHVATEQDLFPVSAEGGLKPEGEHRDHGDET